MAGTVMPAPKFVGLDANANPVSGGKLYTYLAGTTTPQPTYSDVNLTVANSNPVVLDSAGRATVFLSGTSYKFVLTDANDVPIWTQDNVQAVAPFSTNLDIEGIAGETIQAGQACYLSNGSGGLIAGRWYLADSDNAYSSSVPQIAIAPGNIGSGQSGTFRLQGAVTKSNAQPDFVVGGTYYVSATAGQLSLTPGTNQRVVGQADTTATLVISPNPPNIAVTPTFVDGITVASTDAGAGAGPYLDLYRESASPATSDQIGEVRFSGRDSAGNKQLYARIYGQIADQTSATEDGQLRFVTVRNGVETLAMVLDENGNLLPDGASQTIGSATKPWLVYHIAANGSLNFDNGDVTITHTAANTLAFAGASTAYTFANGPVRPASNDGAALGVSGTAWSDLFLASGGVVNFAGDVTITHAADALTFAGASNGYAFNDGKLTVTGVQDTINARYDVNGEASVLNLRNATNGTAAIAALYLSNDAGTVGVLRAYSSGFTTSGLAIADSLRISANRVGGLSLIASDPNGSIRFATGGLVEQMRLSESGELWIGYTADQGAYRLQVNSQIFATNATIATSDARFKTDVQPVQHGLAAVRALKPVAFRWKPHPIHNFIAGTDVGFLAQQVQQALAGRAYADTVVTTNGAGDDEFLGMADAKLIPLLVAAVQELAAKVDALTAQ